MFLSKALDKPLIVWSFASTVGVSSNSLSALVVSGPMEASLSSGLLLHISTNPNRASKFFTAELLANVIQFAPLSSKASTAPFLSSVSGTVL